MKKPLKTRYLLLLIIGATIVVLVCLHQITNNGKRTPLKPRSITYSTDTPDENKPHKDYKWQGAANTPKYMKLDSIGAEGFIQNVGVDQHNQVAVPNNIYMAGWFSKGAIPGAEGLSIIDGHVTGRHHDGIFKNLKNLQQNDRFTIQFGNGSIKQFIVRQVAEVPLADAPGLLFSQKPKITSQLNLITCGGVYDHQASTYDKRVIVVSELVQNL